MVVQGVTNRRVVGVSGGLCLLHLRIAGEEFDVVTVRIEHKRRVIAGGIILTIAGAAIIPPSGCQSSGICCSNLCDTGCRKAQMKASWPKRRFKNQKARDIARAKSGHA